MEELILKIKGLKEIQPEKDWIKATKTQILSQEQEGFSKGFSFPSLFSLNWMTNRGVLVFPAMLIVIVMGVFFYNRNLLYLEKASVDLKVLEAISHGLNTVQSDIMLTTVNLEKIENPEKAIEIGKMVSSTLESGGKVVAITKKMMEDPKPSNGERVFTVISDVESTTQEIEDALQSMEETYIEKQKELARNLIEDLESRNLTEAQLLLLEKAKNDYNEARFDQALIGAIEASQIE